MSHYIERKSIRLLFHRLLPLEEEHDSLPIVHATITNDETVDESEKDDIDIV